MVLPNKTSFRFYCILGWGFAHRQKRIIPDITKLVITNRSFLEFFLVTSLVKVRMSTLPISSLYICKTIKLFSQFLCMVDPIFVFHLLNS